MSLRYLIASSAAVAAVMFCTGTAAIAADVTPAAPPATYVGAGQVVGGCADCATGGCATCQHGVQKSSCATCGKSLILGNHMNRTKGMYQVNLCPGACFGYFQTQWRKWDEVCPYPYLGTGVNDAPRPPTGVLNPKTPSGGELTPPRPVDPKTMPEPKKTSGVYLPPIPTTPSKFAP